MSAQRWPAELAPPVLPLETWQVSQAMSANTRDGRLPHWDEAREYAREDQGERT